MQDIQTALSRVTKKVFNQELTPELTRPDEQFGDFATNIALQLAGKLGKPPRQVAEELVANLKPELQAVVADISIAGPGFINFTLSDEALANLVHESAGARTQHFKGKTVVIETNNPNPFKDMHIGHAYNSIIADTLANLLEAGGAKVHRVSYHGDVGLHVGRSMWAILKYVEGDPSKLNAIPVGERAGFMSKMYVHGARADREDTAAHEEIEQLTQQSFVLTDPLFKKVYETCKQWSFDYLDSIIARIGSQPVERRYLEREADELGRKTVESHIGDVFEQSDGAVVFKGEKYGLHTRVFISSRGTTLYEARDLGLIQLKHRDFHPDASYIVTGEEQRDYFNVVLKAAALAMPETEGETRNIPTGLVKLTTGKMSSRTGEVVNIEWLFDSLSEAVQARGNQNSAIVPTVAMAALRYAFLKVGIGSDVIFDVNESVSLDGNTGPYLQYAHARARSILQKAGKGGEGKMAEFDPHERTLARKISEYPDILQRAIAELRPHHICTYLYELAQTFNRFYEHNRVIGDERQATRQHLVQLYTDVLKDGLSLLSIPAPDRL